MNDKQLGRYYMVHNWTRGSQGNGGVATKMHRTFNGAKGEACRLARMQPGEVFVILTSTTAYRVDLTPITEMYIGGEEKEVGDVTP